MHNSKKLYEQLTDMWDQQKDLTIPKNHRSRFIEAIQELQFDVMNQVLNKEIYELNSEKSQIQSVQKAIFAREECINQIRQCDQRELRKNA